MSVIIVIPAEIRYRRFHVLVLDDLQAVCLVVNVWWEGSASRLGGFGAGLGRGVCLHLEINSVLLLSEFLLVIIATFSSIQRLHEPLFLGLRFDFFSIFQVKEYLALASLSVHIYFDS